MVAVVTVVTVVTVKLQGGGDDSLMIHLPAVHSAALPAGIPAESSRSAGRTMPRCDNLYPAWHAVSRTECPM